MNESKRSGRGAQRLWRGLTTVTASVLALALCAQPLVDANRTDIDKFLGTQSSRIVTDTTGGQDLFTYKSDYASTTELLNAIEDLGERMSEEGTVLLKNNGALPLTAGEKGKVSLLGFSSYYPVMGGIMGSSLTPNQGTSADTVDLVQALTARGFTLNPELQPLYNSLEATFTTEVQSWGGTITYNTITAPGIGGVFSSKEPSQAAMDGAAVAEKFTYWTVDAVGQDAQLMAALKQALTWQNYALANSNALDGLSSNSRLVSVRAWYDNLVTGLQIGFGVLTLACAAMYVMSTKKKD